ncbi:hypothetical protein KI387_012254 [Taxus chinensis]|uniref:Uncharacterized protein n=1 Tax=Taxus chinensis TaxID=29808 RepID=A0AA38FGR2_TAXCH|nr:hypothetical protein KI387_012254 [Taxus chinensis]
MDAHDSRSGVPFENLKVAEDWPKTDQRGDEFGVDMAAVINRDIVISSLVTRQKVATAKSKEPEEFQEEHVLDQDAIAQTYWQLHIQDQSAWTQELNLRPFSDRF